MRWFMQILTSIRPQERNRDFLLQSWEKLKFQCRKKEIKTELQKVLDNFDAICSDLNIGLPAEIEARKNSMNIIGICS